ncbi:MAG: hypothetical protein JO089_02710, partial [Alphaproteobacteria bacterium]|nr:hypothetical protein [Alphaproteobacteria bacterium]
MHSTRRLTYTTLLSTLLSACASAAFAGQIIYSAQSTDYASIQQSPGNNASIMQSYNTNVYPPGGNQPIPLTPDDFGHDGAVINVNGTGNNSAIFQGEDRYDAAAITIVGNNNAASISEQSGYFTSAAGIGNSNNDNIVI